jgi:lysophospholipase L1-like esterase
MTHRGRGSGLFSILPLILLCTNAPAATAAPPSSHWVGTWGTSPVAAVNANEKILHSDTTLREIVHISISGPEARIVLSNEFGLEPLTIGAASVAISAGDSSISGSANPVTFGGRPSAIIPPGAMLVSDPVVLTLPPFANVAVSFYLPKQAISQLSIHNLASQTNYISTGNATTEAKLNSPSEIYSWPILKELDVKAGGNSAAIVTFGDSITDGTMSTRNANARWPDVLAQRLQANKKTASLAVINEGIGGNRVLHDIYGPSALARFDRDVLSQAGVKYLTIMLGINDISHATDPVKPYDYVSADDVIFGLGQLIERAHIHGIKVMGATLTPYAGNKYFSPAGEAMREAVNTWIRSSNQLDGVIDFDKATQDPANPTAFLSADDSGDHLHPNDAGYKIMGQSIDLKLFESK